MTASQFLKLTVRLLSLAIFCLTVAPQANAQQVISGIQVFPATNVWNTRIDGLPVDKNSSKYISALGTSRNIHPDLGTDPSYGIPFNVVNTPLTTSPTFQYLPDSDLGPYPTVTTSLLIEGSSWNINTNGGDRHVLQIDTNNGILYELYYTQVDGLGNVTARSGAIFPLNSNALRMNGYTSADAAGLPIFPGLINYTEAAAGPIKHAFRMTGNGVNGYIWPARHLVNQVNEGFPPFGQRFRLKKSYSIPSGFTPLVKNIMTALQQYGMFYADIGSSWYITGTPNANWLQSDINALETLKGSDFEAVDESSLMVNPDSAAAPLSKPVAPPSPKPWPKVK